MGDGRSGEDGYHPVDIPHQSSAGDESLCRR